MMSVFALAAWSLLGAVIAFRLATPEERRIDWLAYGIILGPLWGVVAAERLAMQPAEANRPPTFATREVGR